jgi:nucleoid DNA-binding protein
MNELFSHIEFLLHMHQCVIVPHFGGFVLNFKPAQKIGLASFSAPECELLFNEELTHNDGLLCESFMRMNNISFEEANYRIDKQVEDLKMSLSAGEQIAFGNLGKFQINEDGHFVFSPNKFIRPEYFGLSSVSLKPVIQMQSSVSNGDKEGIHRKLVVRNIGIASAVAAVIAVIIVLLSPFEKNVPSSQNANILSETPIFKNSSEKTLSIPISKTTSENKSTAPDLSEGESAQKEPMLAGNLATDAKPTTKYYIIMGVYELRSGAEFTTRALKSEGFSNVRWIEKPGRIDLYSAVFTDRTEAETYLKTLHKNYPNHADAWIMKRAN